MYVLKASALLIITVVTLGMNSHANALDVGQKGSFAEIEKDLVKERQVEVARAKYVLNSNGPGKSKVLCVKFTINLNGDAYILMSDSMDDSTAKIEMVYGKMKSARVYDPKNVGVLPQGVLDQTNLANLIKRGATGGDGVLLHGQSVKKQANGSEALVGSTTVMANVSQSMNPAISNTIGILVTSNDDVTNLDKVVATELKYRLDQVR